MAKKQKGGSEYVQSNTDRRAGQYAVRRADALNAAHEGDRDRLQEMGITEEELNRYHREAKQPDP